jgi:hypothetical protein
MKVYTVVWACGSADDHDVVHTNVGVHGVYTSKESAKVGLEECKQRTLDELADAVDPDGDMPELMDEIDLDIEGSVDDEYFRIEYTLGCEPVNELIKIEEQELTD